MMYPTASAILWSLLNPGSLLALCLLLGGLGGWLPWRRVRRAGRALLALGVAGLGIVAVLPVGDLLLAPLEDRFPVPRLPAEIDGLVVLGGAVDLARASARGRPEISGAGERLTAMVTLMRRYPGARAVFTGGFRFAAEDDRREADVARQLLADLGVDRGRVIFERAARNTRQNAVLARALVDPKPGETWLLVTSAAHMPRAVGAFRKLGWPVLAYPVDYRGPPPWRPLLHLDLAGELVKVNLAVHEWLGLAVYRVAGWSDALLPGPAVPP